MNLTINITVDNANKVLRALGNLPYDEVAPLIGDLVRQANEQIQAQQVQPVVKPEPLPEPEAPRAE